MIPINDNKEEKKTAPQTEAEEVKAESEQCPSTEAEPEKEKARIRLRFAGIAPEDIRGGVALLREVSRL